MYLEFFGAETMVSIREDLSAILKTKDRRKLYLNKIKR